MGATTWDRTSLSVVAGLCALKAVVHLIYANQYGYHGDELYFIECGRHLAFGYVDHPPLIPWLARLTDELGGGLLTLRLPAIAAGTGTMLVTSLLVREWGGRWRAQLLALLCLLLGPAHLRLAAMLNIPVIEIFLCTLTAYLVVRAIARRESWTWVLAGAALGLAVLAKHSSLLWGGALAGGLVLSPQRRALASRWPWLGVGVAFVLVVPNLVWQMENGFASLEFMRALRHEVLATQGRALFAAAQILYFGPFAAPVWLAGLSFAFTRSGSTCRPFALLFVVMFMFLLVAGGKPYYLGSAYPPVLAAGGVALERWLAPRVVLRRLLVAALAVTGVALSFVSLPILPIRQLDAIVGTVLGWAIPPMALTHDMHGMYGWEQHARTIEEVYRSLPDQERKSASVLAGTYSQASAINVLSGGETPRAVSGNMTYYLWGPDGDRGEVLIAYGVPRELIDLHYSRCEARARIDAPLARPWDTKLPVYVCRKPFGTMADFWPDLRQFGHGPPKVPSAREPFASPQQ